MEENEHPDFMVPQEIRRKVAAFLSKKIDSDTNRTINHLFSELKSAASNQVVLEIETTAPADYGSTAIDKMLELLNLYESLSKIIFQGTPHEKTHGSPSRGDLILIRRLPAILEDLVEHYAEHLSPGTIADASTILQEYNKIFPVELRKDGP